MASGIYVITAAPSGEQYVGSTTSFERRWKQHRDALQAGKHENAMLQHAWINFGESAFTFAILEDGVDAADLRGREAFYAATLSPVFNRANLTTVPWTGVTVTMTHESMLRIDALTASQWKSRSQWLDTLLRTDPFISTILGGDAIDREAWESYVRDARARYFRERAQRSLITFRLSCEVLDALDRVAPISRGTYLEDVIARQLEVNDHDTYVRRVWQRPRRGDVPGVPRRTR